MYKVNKSALIRIREHRIRIWFYIYKFNAERYTVMPHKEYKGIHISTNAYDMFLGVGKWKSCI